MQVTHIVPAISNEASGPSYSVVRLCQSLVDHGENVTLATLESGQISAPPPFLKTFPKSFGPQKLGRSSAMKKWLLSKTCTNSVELIHNHSLWMMPNVYPGIAARKSHVPYIVAPRGTLSEWAMASGSWVKKAFWPFIQKPALDPVTCFHATAASEYEDIRRLGFQQPVAIIPNGVDIPDLPPKLYSNTRTLLFLSRIHPTKGLDILLKAWGALQNRFDDWEIRIVGPDSGDGYLPKMKRLATELGLKRVTFEGPLYGTDKLEAYRKSELFVLPTHSENFGMAVAEALASGVPVIVTKGAPWGELEQNKGGWWIDIGLGPLVACLEKALTVSPENLSEMGLHGRAWMKNEYSWDKIGLRMLEVYNWVLKGGRKPDCVLQE